MESFDSAIERLQALLEAGELEAATDFVDQLAEIDSEELDALWRLDEGVSRYYLAAFYNNIGYSYRSRGPKAYEQQNEEALLAVARGSERCHEKALDMYDMSAESFIYMPRNSPFSKDAILMFSGLGSSKYLLGKYEESKKYILLCLRMPAIDEQTQAWHAQASYFMRLLDNVPVQIALKARSVAPNLFNPNLLQVQGELLEWGSYAKPQETEFLVLLTEEAIDRLTAQGLANAASLEKRVLVLRTNESGNLNQPLSLLEVL